MNRPLVYIDQNVVGLHLEGKIRLSKRPALYWVYSKEHFAKIKRSSNSEQYLSVLDEIDAKLLDLELDAHWKITGTAKLIEHGNPTQHYESYMEAIGEVDSCENLFDPFLAWVNGGSDEGSFKELPDRLAERVLSLTEELPLDGQFVLRILNTLKPEFTDMIERMVENGNDITKTRKAFGDGKGAVGAIRGKNQLQQIWDIIVPSIPGISCDQFFGFDPVDKQGYETWPVYLGIVGCCAVLDIVGFQAEKKCRKLDKIPNIHSDSSHIAMGAFCSAILSEDKKLVRRARAIYEYKGIGTVPLLIEIKANKSMQSTAKATAD